MIISYLGASTDRQNPANRQDEIRRFADSRNFSINQWITEVTSGKKKGCDRKLRGLIRRMRHDDTLIVTEVPRLSRTLTDLMAIMGGCLEKGINLYTTKEGYSFDNSTSSKVLCFAFGPVAEIERNLISTCTREVLALWKAEGVVLGRKKGSCTKMSVLIENRRVVVGILKQNCTITDIYRRFDISRDTFLEFRNCYKEVDKAMKEKETRRKGKLQEWTA